MSRQTIINSIVVIIIAAFVFNAGIFGYWLFITLLFYIEFRIIISAIKAIRHHRKKKYASSKEFLAKLTARLMAFFFISGTILYAFVFPVVGGKYLHDFNNTELVFRAMICSLDMFMLDIDSNIIDQLKGWPLLKALIVVQCTLSFACTMTLLANLMLARGKAYYKLYHKTKITSDNNHLYIFFGINDNSRLLASDIHGKDPKAITIFVDEANMKEDENNSWDNIVNLFTHRQKTFEYADDSNSLVAIASKQLCDIDISKIDANDPDILSMIGLEKLKDLIISVEAHQNSLLHIFFLSENEDNNIRCLINLAKDSTILSVAHGKTVEEKIYCHARYNGPNRMVEDLAVRKSLDVEIIDSSHISVELLKSRKADQPVRVACLSEEYPTTVSKPLEALIVGFGEVGRDSFRFLYEFGTFLEMKDGKPLTAKPHITVVDSRMKVLEGLFRANTPAIRYDDGSISLLEMDCQEYSFYGKCLSEEKCNSLNYIVLALGDDDSNISLATAIFNRIRRYRSDMSHLIIMVRCVSDKNLEMMQKIAGHYNKGCDTDSREVIRLFGNPKEVYSYSTIIRDELTRKGITYLDNYSRISKEPEYWQGRRDKLTGYADRMSGKDVYPNIDNLRKLRRKESQDLANALHASTKMWLLQEALGKHYDWKGFILRFFSMSGESTLVSTLNGIYYPGLSVKENDILLHLAMLEHIRWNAAHELLGYIPNDEKPSCDERSLRHNCLRDWEELDDQSRKASTPEWACNYKVYDFCVIDTSISLFRDKLGKIN